MIHIFVVTTMIGSGCLPIIRNVVHFDVVNENKGILVIPTLENQIVQADGNLTVGNIKELESLGCQVACAEKIQAA